MNKNMLAIKQTFSSSSDGYDNLNDSHDNSVMSGNVLDDSYLVMLNQSNAKLSFSQHQHHHNMSTLSKLSNNNNNNDVVSKKMVKKSSRYGQSSNISGIIPTDSAHTKIDKELTNISSISKREKATMRRHFTAFLSIIMFIIGIILIAVCVTLFRRHNRNRIIVNNNINSPNKDLTFTDMSTNDTDIPLLNITDVNGTYTVFNTTTESTDFLLQFFNVTETVSNNSLTSFESTCSEYFNLRNNTATLVFNVTYTNSSSIDQNDTQGFYINFECIIQSQSLHRKGNVIVQGMDKSLNVHVQVSAQLATTTTTTPLLATKSSINDTVDTTLPLSSLLIDWVNTTGDSILLNMLRNNSNLSDVFQMSSSVVVATIEPTTTTNSSNTSSIQVPTSKPSTTIELKPIVSSNNTEIKQSLYGCKIEQQRRLMLDIDLSIRFYTEAYSKTVTCEVTYSGGEKWIGISFAPSSSMIPAMATIGLPGLTTNANDTNVWRYVLLSKSIDGVTRNNVSQTLQNTSLIQNTTHTVLQFTKLLKDIDDGFHIPLAGSISMNYAIGCTNDLKSGHCSHGSVSFSDILPCNRSLTLGSNDTTSNQLNSMDVLSKRVPRKPSASVPADNVTNIDDKLLCNGYSVYCDVPVNTVLFAGVHNAHVSQQDQYMLFPNQEFNIHGALLAGFRAINVDLGICDTIGTVSLVHGVCISGTTRNATAAFEDIANFLMDNPNEIIILPTQITNTIKGGDVTNDSIDSIFKSIPNFTEMMYSHSPTAKIWPTMRELIQSNKRIIYMQYNSNFKCNTGNSSNSAVSNTIPTKSDCPDGFHDWFQYAVENQFEYKNIDELTDTTYACEITRGDNKVTPDFVLYNIFTTIASDTNAAITNEYDFLQNFITNCTTINKIQPSVVLVDFWNIGNVIEFVEEHNEIELGNTTTI